MFWLIPRLPPPLQLSRNLIKTNEEQRFGRQLGRSPTVTAYQENPTEIAPGSVTLTS